MTVEPPSGIQEGRSRSGSRDLSRSLAVLLGAALLLLSHRAHADDALTVEQALREGRAANAQLPLAALDIASARERLGEAKARRWLQVSVEAGLRYAPPFARYGTDDLCAHPGVVSEHNRFSYSIRTGVRESRLTDGEHWGHMKGMPPAMPMHGDRHDGGMGYRMQGYP